MSEDLPTRIGTYDIVGPLGEGGMGRVYVGRDVALGRDVAIKVLLPELARDPAMSARFLREARAMARISSPYVVTVFQVGEDDGRPFLVMELLGGEDLSERLKREGRLPWAVAAAFIVDAARGLDAARGAGLIHRDVKPANLFIVDDGAARATCKLTDFGLARPLDGSADLTQAGLVVGTPHYLAPEVAKGSEASVQSDLYALGATLFELVAGEPPYVGKTVVEVLSQHLTSSIPDLGARVPDVPRPLVALVTRLLAKRPEDRLQSYPELLDALAHLDDAPLPQHTMPLAALAAPPPADARVGAPPAAAAPSAPAPRAPASLPPPSDTVVLDKPSPSQTMSTSVALPKVSGAVPTVKTAPLTVMFTDIAGYTERTGQQSREEAARWLQLHDALMQPVLKAFGGKLVKTIGDAFLTTFTSPTDAVLCGMAIQDRLFVHNQTASPSEQIHVRVALSAGEVRIHKGDVFGEAVNLAARLEGLAEPGEVLLSDAVYATMNTAEANLESRGEQRFKGIQRAVHVYRCVPVGDATTPPYGGHLLARVGDSAMARVVDVAGRAAKAAEEARSRVGRGFRALATRVAAVEGPPSTTAARARVTAVLARHRYTVLGIAIALLAMVVVASADFRLGRIDDGEAAAVLAELDAIPESERSPDDVLLRGHALFALEKKTSAMRAYREAITLGVVDDRALENAIAHLGSKTARQLLIDWPDDDVDDALADLLDGDWTTRHHAFMVLEARDTISDDDVTALALLDLANEGCKEREYAVNLLKRRGRGRDAVRALEDAKARPEKGTNVIFACKIDYDAAIAAVVARD